MNNREDVTLLHRLIRSYCFMEVKTDIEIAQENEMYPITEIVDRLGIDKKYVDL